MTFSNGRNRIDRRSGRASSTTGTKGMGYRIESRDLTNEERRFANAPRLPPAVAAVPGALLRFVLILALSFAVLMAFAGIVVPLTMELGWNPTVPDWTTPVLIAVLWGPVLIVPAFSAIRGYRRLHLNGMVRLLDAQGRAQVITVSGAKFVTMVDADDCATYLFDLGEQTLLISASEIATRRELFGLPSIDEYQDELEIGDQDEDENEDFLAVPFPNSDFVLHRFPYSGRILAIELKGEPQRCEREVHANELPHATIDWLRREQPGETALIDRSLAQLIGPMAAE